MKKEFSSIKRNRNTCITLLNSLLDKKVPVQEVINKWPKDMGDDLVDTIYGLLFHYRDDEDIRKKDLRYADWQDDQIRELMLSLKIDLE